MPVLISLFILGAIIGSFLNVAVFRLGTGERMGNARSRCFSCGKILRWHELIPLVSFFIQKGKCRKCGSKISWQYPIVEFVTGAVFTLVTYHVFDYASCASLACLFTGGQGWLDAVFLFILFSLLIAISVYDFRHKIIPNQFVYSFIVISFFFPLFNGLYFVIQDIVPHVVAGSAAFLFFASLWFVSKGKWMGFGDAKLALGIGFLLGPFQTILAVMFSFWLGTLIAVPVMLLYGRGLKTQVPFGPFLAAGCFIAWMWGEQFLGVYASLL